MKIKQISLVAIGTAVVAAIILGTMLAASEPGIPVDWKIGKDQGSPTDSQIGSLPSVSNTGTKVGTTTTAKRSRLVVVATTFPLYDFIQNVADNLVELNVLIQPGQEFHNWEPTPRSLDLVRRADILVYNGAGLEPWMDRLIESVGKKTLLTVNTSEGLKLIETRGKERQSFDPHVWLDPINAKHQVTKIRDGLINIDPANRDSYQRNADGYLKRLDELHDEITTEIAGQRRRVFVAFHSAFSYFAQRYNLTQYTVIGADPDKEPSAREITNLIEVGKDIKVKVVYAEPLHDSRLPQVVAEQIGGRVLVLDPMDGILEEEIRAGASYLGKMRINLKNLLEGLKAG